MIRNTFRRPPSGSRWRQSAAPEPLMEGVIGEKAATPVASRFENVLAIARGLLPLALVAIVLSGWYAQITPLRHVLSPLSPMPPFATLGFLLCSLALFALCRQWSWLVTLCGTCVTLIGLLMLAVYLCDLDTLPLLRQSMRTVTKFPSGSITLNMGLSFTLGGTGFLLLGRSQRLSFHLLSAAPFGAIVLVFGAVGSVRHLLGLELSRWGSLTYMDIPSALGAIVVGGGILLWAWRIDQAKGAGGWRRLPMLIGIAVLTVALCLWQALSAYERESIQRTLEIAVISAQSKVVSEISASVLALTRMGKRWETLGKPSRASWATDAELYLEYPGLQAVAWVDPGWYFRWVAPESARDLLEGVFLGAEERHKEALELAQGSRQVTGTRVLDLLQGGQGFHVYIPIYRDGTFDGYIAGIFQIQALLDHLLADMVGHYGVSIVVGDDRVYSRSFPLTPLATSWMRDVTMGLYGVTWHLQIWPTTRQLSKERTLLPELVLAVGLVFAALLLITTHLAQTARQHALQVNRVNHELQEEIVEHKHTAHALGTSAIENARLYEALENRFVRLQTLRQLNQLISSSLDINEVLREIARAAATLKEARLASFWVVDEQRQTLHVKAFSDDPLAADFPLQILAFDQGGVGWVAAHRRILHVADVFNDGRFIALDWWRAHDLHSFLGVPIFLDQALLAVLALNSQHPFRLDAEDQQLLQSLAAQAAVAFRNARLYSDIQDRTAYLVKLNGELHNEVVERKRAEEALRESEQRYRSVTRSAHDAIVTSDRHGTIVDWNQGAQMMFGYEEAEAVGQPLTLLVPDRYQKAHEYGIDRLGQTGQSHLVGKTTEFVGCHKDGHEFPLEMSLAMWPAGGEVFYTGIIRDITERRRTEEQLRQQQEALYQREKLAAMGSLLANVAHELNNPLSIIVMETDLLSEEAASGALAGHARRITQAAQRCVRIVQNFLALARERSSERTSVQLNTVIEDAVELLAYPLRVDNIVIRTRLASDLPLISGDPHQLQQVMVNLITNAHQALRDTPTPRQLSLVTVYHAKQQQIVLEVTDSGTGIPPEIQQRVFEPFFTTKPPGVGTGLGLPLCQGIIESHGGTIRIVSQPGQGATFRIELPVEGVPSAPHGETALPDLPSTIDSKTILVVDDETGIASALAYLLRRDGHKVDTAGNGRIALQLLQHFDYDLILSDVKMPDLDGPGLYHELQNQYPHLLGRIVFLTGDTLSAQTKTFLEQSGVVRMHKPFSAAEVRRVVQRVLETPV